MNPTVLLIQSSWRWQPRQYLRLSRTTGCSQRYSVGAKTPRLCQYPEEEFGCWPLAQPVLCNTSCSLEYRGAALDNSLESPRNRRTAEDALRCQADKPNPTRHQDSHQESGGFHGRSSPHLFASHPEHVTLKVFTGARQT